MIDITKIIKKGRSESKKYVNKIYASYTKRLRENAIAIIAQIESMYANNTLSQKKLASLLAMLDDTAAQLLASVPKIAIGQVSFIQSVMERLGLRTKAMPDNLRAIITERTKKYKVPAEYRQYAAQGGKDMKTLVKDQAARTTLYVKKALSSVLTGSYDLKTAKKLIRQAFNKAANHGRTITTTEFHRVTSVSEYYGVGQTDDIKRYMISALDNKARPQSVAIDGKFEDSKGEWHYNGHSTKYPGGWGVAAYDINDREVVGYAIDETTDTGSRAARNLETGLTEIMNINTFEQYYKMFGL